MVGSDAYTYDYLILAAGLKTHYHGHDEWREFAPGLKSIEEATDIRARFLLAFEQAEIEQDEDAKLALYRTPATLTLAGNLGMDDEDDDVATFSFGTMKFPFPDAGTVYTGADILSISSNGYIRRRPSIYRN